MHIIRFQDLNDGTVHSVVTDAVGATVHVFERAGVPFTVHTDFGAQLVADDLGYGPFEHWLPKGARFLSRAERAAGKKAVLAPTGLPAPNPFRNLEPGHYTASGYVGRYRGEEHGSPVMWEDGPISLTVFIGSVAGSPAPSVTVHVPGNHALLYGPTAWNGHDEALYEGGWAVRLVRGSLTPAA